MFYVMGVDPALGEKASSCDGALVVGRGVIPPGVVASEAGGRLSLMDVQLDVVYARVLRNRMVSEWAGEIHELDGRFGLDLICLDAGKGGAGPDIRKELARPLAYLPGMEVASPVQPITSINEMTVVGGKQSLMMFSRGDPWLSVVCAHFRGDDQLVNWGHMELERVLRAGVLGLPADGPGRGRVVKEMPEHANRGAEWFEAWHQCDRLRRQLALYGVEKRGIEQGDGTVVMAQKLTANGARVFVSTDMMDLVDGCMMMVSAASVWLWNQPVDGGESDGGGVLSW